MCNSYMKKLLHILFALLFFPIAAFAGSQTFSTPGNHTFTVPAYTGTLTVEVWGGGGGAQGIISLACNAVSTGNSSWNGTVIAGNGAGGFGLNCGAAGGSGGVASGGDTDINGNPGDAGTFFSTNHGGDAPYGGAGAVCPPPFYGAIVFRGHSRRGRVWRKYLARRFRRLGRLLENHLRIRHPCAWVCNPRRRRRGFCHQCWSYS